MTENRKPRRKTAARYAVAQSISEVGLGSVLHGFHVPWGGHFLSLNQALILTFAAKGAVNRRDAIAMVSAISNSAAVLKSLSPAGRKLGPMVAISTQGALYGLGLGLVGANALGAATGAALLSLWAFLQPLLSAYVIFGSTLFEALLRIWRDITEALHLPAEIGPWILLGIVTLKMLLAITVALVGWFGPRRLERRYFAYLQRMGKKMPRRIKAAPQESAVGGALKDMAHPLFLFSCALSVGFFALQKHDGAAAIALYGLRLFALGLLFFWAVRALPPYLKKFRRH